MHLEKNSRNITVKSSSSYLSKLIRFSCFSFLKVFRFMVQDLHDSLVEYRLKTLLHELHLILNQWLFSSPLVESDSVFIWKGIWCLFSTSKYKQIFRLLVFYHLKSTEHQLMQSSEDKESLEKTSRRQNVRKGLTNIGDKKLFHAARQENTTYRDIYKYWFALIKFSVLLFLNFRVTSYYLNRFVTNLKCMLKKMLLRYCSAKLYRSRSTA